MQIPKDLFYGELNQGKRPTNRPQRLRCKDVYWRDLKALGIDINKWETVDSERSARRQVLQQGLSEFEETLAEQVETKRQTRKALNQGDRPATDHICSHCRRDCHSRIGLSSHTRRPSSTINQSATP